MKEWERGREGTRVIKHTHTHGDTHTWEKSQIYLRVDFVDRDELFALWNDRRTKERVASLTHSLSLSPLTARLSLSKHIFLFSYNVWFKGWSEWFVSGVMGETDLWTLHWSSHRYTDTVTWRRRKAISSLWPQWQFTLPCGWIFQRNKITVHTACRCWCSCQSNWMSQVFEFWRRERDEVYL